MPLYRWLPLGVALSFSMGFAPLVLISIFKRVSFVAITVAGFIIFVGIGVILHGELARSLSDGLFTSFMFGLMAGALVYFSQLRTNKDS